MSKQKVTFGEAQGKGKVEDLRNALGGADGALDYVARKLRVRYDELGPTLNRGTAGVMGTILRGGQAVDIPRWMGEATKSLSAASTSVESLRKEVASIEKDYDRWKKNLERWAKKNEGGGGDRVRLQKELEKHHDELQDIMGRINKVAGLY